MSIEKWIEHELLRCINRRQAKNRKTPQHPSEGAMGWEVTSKQSIPFILSPKDRLKHLYILGSTGCGKTNLVSQLVEKDIQENRSVAILDLRGDLIDKVVTFLAGKVEPERIHLIDLRKPEHSQGINLLHSSDPYSSALQVHSILKTAADSWGVQLDETLRCSLIALSYAKQSLTDLPKLLTDASFRADILPKCGDINVQAFFERFEGLSSEKQLAWTLPVLNKVSPFLSHPTVREVLAVRKPLDLRAALDTPGSIFLCALAADRLHGLAGLFGCLVVNAIENTAMQRVDTAESDRNPVHLYIDEFENFRSTAFESIIAEGRRFRLGLTLSHQNLHQLDVRLRHVITNNAATRIYFRTGMLDASELGKELTGYGIKDPVKLLLHLPVGEAFVIDQSKKARRIRFKEATRSKFNKTLNDKLFQEIGTRTPLVHVPEDIPETKVKHVRKPRAAKPKEGSE